MENAGSMENRQNQTLSLNDLQEGVYQFKVIVSGGNPSVHGEGFGNVTVLPRKCNFLSICRSYLSEPTPGVKKIHPFASDIGVI